MWETSGLGERVDISPLIDRRIFSKSIPGASNSHSPIEVPHFYFSRHSSCKDVRMGSLSLDGITRETTLASVLVRNAWLIKLAKLFRLSPLTGACKHLFGKGIKCFQGLRVLLSAMLSRMDDNFLLFHV